MGIVENIARKGSAKLARYQIRKNLKQSRSPEETFKASWESLLSNRLYRFLIRISQNPAKEGTQIRGRTFEMLSVGIPDFYRSTGIMISDNLKAALGNKKPFLIAEIHDGHRFHSRVLVDHKREFTRVVADPAGYIRWLRQLGIDVSRAHAIKDNILSLARLREAVGKNQVICCAIDYGDASGRKAYINPAIFGFANRVKIPVFFVKACVNNAGVGELVSSGPYNDVDPLTCARKFLDFYNAVGESRVDMKIKRYTEHLDWNNRRWRVRKLRSLSRS